MITKNNYSVPINVLMVTECYEVTNHEIRNQLNINVVNNVVNGLILYVKSLFIASGSQSLLI